MSVTRITEVNCWQVLDSRGNPTIAARVHVVSGNAKAIAPAGASTGAHEACFIRDQAEAFNGMGVDQQIANYSALLRQSLIGVDAADPAAVEQALRTIDSTPNYSKLGGHFAVSVSIASWLAAAAAQNREPYELIAEYTGAKPSIPSPMVNILSGGAHAGRAIDLQDILVMPLSQHSFASALEMAWQTRWAMRELLAQEGHNVNLVADEGGLAARLRSDEEAISMVHTAIKNAGFRNRAAIAIDIAANEVFQDGSYRLNSGEVLSFREFTSRYQDWCQRFDVVSIEDGAAEDDEAGWRELAALRDVIQILGDDRYATQVERLQVGIANAEANAILIKPNQAGTLAGALGALTLAKSHGWATVVSARSGDTEESWLADLAVGSDAGQIKVGSTMRSERTAKWNRLLELEYDSRNSRRSPIPFAPFNDNGR
jgi:enolase